MLTTKGTKWIAFDFDDTLHDFGHAATAATEALFAKIAATHHDVDIAQLRVNYQRIGAGFINGFTDGRTSHAYRSERFTALLNSVEKSAVQRTAGINARAEPSPSNSTTASDALTIDYLIHLYAAAFAGALTLNESALSTITALRNAGFKIAIISEGPHDAQELHLRTLGMHALIDLLLTSNRERISKTDGLFQKFVEQTGVVPETVMFVGDSLDRDILPALGAGLRAVLFDPRHRVPANAVPDGCTVITRLDEILPIAQLTQ